jgi:hypothetical protein
MRQMARFGLTLQRANVCFVPLEIAASHSHFLTDRGSPRLFFATLPGDTDELQLARIPPISSWMDSFPSGGVTLSGS